ncbi:glycosyltransferase family 39 protein [Saccharopolyspora gloriosae]|uniref:4-amino-4-deoxy-L-arabinose transferase-like glycosyltransferase n=1 Tax=Saccharopolyspora gloriosae TaxID=455344 RepID=A0A840NQA0_9PSEU|nr:glycosyltransferase family 39 protein [Saccharopolyspora gloriosae]MBB5071449.1 4-amino-4-deoxy-L-arabinose transferase-like glycosyltransferase [Saccharopolyspora gloriosae]
MTTVALGAPRSDAADAPARSRWQPFALAAICLLSAVLYAWGIGDSWGNTYYSAAVKSMSQSFENFLFGAFDPAGVVTVDKPPMALWVQVISVQVFGYNKFAVLLPQAVLGVAGVFLLHRTVRRWAGEHAALLAALVLALTPITVAINRDNNPDTLLVLLVVAAAYALTRALRAERSSRATWWLVLSAALIGCGFLTKMLQAWMLLPVFIAVYLVGREASWARKAVDLAVAAVTVLVTSFWWVAVTMLWPSPKPYVGGSEDGSAWDLIFGYNGFGRILGGEGNGGGGGPGGGGPGGGGGFSGESGVLRFANEQLAGQISWLLPLCLLVLVAVAGGAVLRRRAGEPGDRFRAAGWVLWGGWLGFIWLMFSFAQGTMHPYYTTMLAPAVGAVAGAGLVRFWAAYRRPEGAAWVLLPLGVVITVGWAAVLVFRDPDWNGWAGYLAIGLGVAAVLALLLGRRKARLGAVALALSLAALLAVPSTWSAATAFAGSTGGMGGANPTAGPSTGMGGPGGGGPPGMPGQGGGDRPDQQDRDGRGARPQGGMPGGMGGESLSDQQRSLLAYVTGGAGDREIPLAVEGGAMGAGSYIINSDLRVIGMGGFMGSDDAPSVELLEQWRQQGELGFVQLGGRGGPGGGGPGRAPGGQNEGDQAGDGRPQGMPGGQGGAASERQEWVRQHCALVDPAAYGGEEAAAEQGEGGTSEGLYDCRG